jgi:hypothetical protein
VCAVSIGRLISLAINRAGTVPNLDMSYHTPVVYLFSVLEVNLTIITASVPIFWPMIATLATNKIWVVNEIEVRVETTSRESISTNTEGDSPDRRSWTKLESKDSFGAPARKLGVVTKTYERSPSRTHRHKASATSSLGRTMGVETGARFSQESQRNLCRIPSIEIGSRNESVSRSRSDSWFAETIKPGAKKEVIPLEERKTER